MINVEKAKKRVLEILSKGGKLNRNSGSSTNIMYQPTWDAFERGYMKAIEDINNKKLN